MPVTANTNRHGVVQAYRQGVFKHEDLVSMGGFSGIQELGEFLESHGQCFFACNA